MVRKREKVLQNEQVQSMNDDDEDDDEDDDDDDDDDDDGQSNQPWAFFSRHLQIQ